MKLLTWSHDGFAFADSYDEVAGLYRGLRGGVMLALADAHAPGLLVKPELAGRQMAVEQASVLSNFGPSGPSTTTAAGAAPTLGAPPLAAARLKRFHGTVVLDATRVGRDASRIGEEVIAHLSGMVGTRVTVTLEIAAEIPDGAPDNVVRTVTENARTLRFTSQGFEKE